MSLVTSFKISYRYVAPTSPHIALVLTYFVTAATFLAAENQAYDFLEEDIVQTVGRFIAKGIKRCTIVVTK